MARPKWDTPFNRALNILKRLLVETRPSYERVHDVGDGTTWKKYYCVTTEERKERQRLTEESINKKVEIVVEKNSAKTAATTVAAVKWELTVLVPAIFGWNKRNPEKDAADFPLADFFGSSSTSIVPAPSPTPAPAPAPAHSSPSFVSDLLSGASSLADLDALTVPVTLALFNKCIISRFHCL